MIYLNDTIKIHIDDTHYRTKYRCSCDKCCVDRGYLSKQNASRPFCRKCTDRHTVESREKMSKAKLGKFPWNKGLKETRPEVLHRRSQARIGSTPWNKGIPISAEQKIKISCTVQGIEQSKFDGFKTGESRIERHRFNDRRLHIRCFEKYDYTCDCCLHRGGTIHAHHLNSWKYFPEQRFELDNVVTLCKICHSTFHAIYGNGKASPNTAEQYIEFKEYTSSLKRILLMYYKK